MSTRSKFVGVVTLCSLFATSLPAQIDGLHDVWRWTTFTVEHGLPSNRVLALLETSNNVPWVSTARGLAWFDGYLWNPVGPRQGLPAGRGTFMLADRDTNVLVVMGRSIYLGNRAGFKELVIDPDTSRPPFTSGALLPSGRFMLLTADGIPYLLHGSVLEPAPRLESSHEFVLSDVRSWSAGRVWVNTSLGLYLGDGKQWTKFLGFGGIPTEIARFTEDAHHNGGALVVQPADKAGFWTWERGGPPHRLTENGLEAIPYILIGARGELTHIEETGLLRTYRKSSPPYAMQSPPAFVGSAFAQFRVNGDLWVGKSNGLHLCRLSARRWVYYRPHPPVPATAVLEILRRRDGSLWVGTTGGIEIHEGQGAGSKISSVDGLPIRTITGLMEDLQGNVWVTSGSAFTGAFCFDGERWTRYGPAEGLDSRFYHRIIRDRSNTLWFLGLETGMTSQQKSLQRSGVFRWDGHRFEMWGEEHEPLHTSVYAMDESAEGTYWFGTIKGLSRWTKGVWKHWATRDGLRSDRVFTLFAPHDGEIWFGDQVHGLGSFTNGQFRYLTTADGLANDGVWEVAGENSGRLWISTRGGASSLYHGVWTTFDGGTGLTHTALWPVLPEDSRVYLGSVGGGTAILHRPTDSLAHIRIVFAEPVIEENHAHIRWYAYPWWGEQSTDGLETRFRIDDGPWSAWSGHRETVAEELEAGDHTFVVQAKDLYGSFDPSGAVLRFVVVSPLFLQPAFALLLIFLASSTVALGWVVLRRRTRQRTDTRITDETSRALLDASADPSYLLDSTGKVLAINQAARSRPGAPPAGSSFFSRIPPALVDSRRIAMEQVIQSGQALRLEDQHDGKHFEHSLHPVPDPRGEATRITFSTRDVTERKQLEATLRSTVQFLQQILESSTTVAIISTDRQGLVRFWNAGAYNVLGFNSDEAVGRITLEHFLPSDDPAHREALVDVSMRVLGGQETVVQVMPFVHKDGRSRTLRVTFSPQNESTGLVQGMLLIGEDITERELARRETEQAERQLRLLAFTLNCAKDAFVITDLDDLILYVNQAFVDTYGYTEEELNGKNVMIVRSPKTPPELAESIRVGTRGSGWSGEVINRRKNGEEFPAELWTSTVRNDQGQPVALVGVAREITERRETENKIKASLEEKEILLKEIHHRVKNNLQIITSLLSLQSAKIPNEEIQAILKESQTRVKSMALVHEELYQSEDLSRVDFADYIRRLTTNLFHTYRTGPVPVSLLVDVEEVYLTVDTAIPCGLMINELVSNALKHAFRGGEGSTVTIRLQRDNTEFLLTVQDNGVGLPPEVDPATTETLGLQLVSTLTRQIGGILTVCRDHGTRFEVRFEEQPPHRRGD